LAAPVILTGVVMLVMTIRVKQQREAGGKHRQRQQLTHGIGSDNS